MGVTIYDIAKRANVGIGTVSRVLNEHPAVSPETRQRVLAVAKELEYHPNAAAQRLARKRNKAIIALMPTITNYFFVEMLKGIQETLYHNDFDLILYGIHHADQLGTYLERTLKVNMADGILLVSMNFPESFEQRFMSKKIPVVVVDRYDRHFDSFSVANTEGTRKAVEYLIDQGHRKLAMICGNQDAVPSVERRNGYLKSILSHAGVINAGVFYPKQNDANDGFSEEAGYEAMKEILTIPLTMRPSAVFIASDIQAIGALRALKEASVPCPDDMSLISFDDIELAQHYGLTTMHQPIQQMGLLASRRLLDRLEKPFSSPVHEKFTPELVVRRTVANRSGRSPLLEPTPR